MYALMIGIKTIHVTTKVAPAVSRETRTHPVRFARLASGLASKRDSRQSV